MKKRTIQLTKKLTLQKENIASLNNDKQSELLGGATAACFTNASCRNCNSQVVCATLYTRGCGCISYHPVSTPACQVC